MKSALVVLNANKILVSQGSMIGIHRNTSIYKTLKTTNLSGLAALLKTLIKSNLTSVVLKQQQTLLP